MAAVDPLSDEALDGLIDGQTKTDDAPVEDVAPVETEEVEVSTETLEALTAPENWADPVREAFNRLSGFGLTEEQAKQLGLDPFAGRDIAQAWLDDHNEYRKGIDAKLQQSADFRKQAEPAMAQNQALQQIFTPLMPYWQQQGKAPDVALNQLAYYAEQLYRDPHSFLPQLAREFGVDLSQALEGVPYVDPQTERALSRIDDLERQMQSRDSEATQARNEQLITEIQQFESATDENGKLKHPNFSKYFDDMMALFELKRASSLDQAYSMCERFDPDVQATKIEEERAEDAKRRNAEAERAIAASKSPDSKSTGSGTAIKSLDEMVDDLVDPHFA